MDDIDAIRIEFKSALAALLKLNPFTSNCCRGRAYPSFRKKNSLVIVQTEQAIFNSVAAPIF